MHIDRKERFVSVAATLAAIALTWLIVRWGGRGSLILLPLICALWLTLHLHFKREMRRLVRGMMKLTPEEQEAVLADHPELADEVESEMERARKDPAGDA